MSSDLPVLNHVNCPNCPTAGPVRVVQFGEGVFLRGFVDWIFEKMRLQGLFTGSIAVVQPISQGRVAGLRRQDGLYTLLLRGVENGRICQEQRIISAISQLVDPYAEFADFLQLAENPELQTVVSNTTEAGIAWLPGCQLADRPAASYPAKLTQFLYHRFCTLGGQADSGLVVLPCELIDQNGRQLRALVLRHTEEWRLPAEFSQWLQTACRFCNTLVDRIVTGWPQAEIASLLQTAGYQDDFFDTAEYFHLWVIEGRPEPGLPFAEAGLNVIWTDDLARYRERKVRVLNGAHTMTFAAAFLSGLDTVGATLADPDLARLLREGLDQEIIPTLPMDRAEAEAYAASVLERFANPFIEHRWLSIALNAVSKFKVRVLPSLLGFCRQFQSVPQRLSFSLAALLLFYRGSALHQPQDDAAVVQIFQDAWQKLGSEPDEAGLARLVETLLARCDLWDLDLNTIPGLRDTVTSHLRNQVRLGMREAVRQLES